MTLTADAGGNNQGWLFVGMILGLAHAEIHDNPDWHVHIFADILALAWQVPPEKYYFWSMEIGEKLPKSILNEFVQSAGIPPGEFR